MSTARRFLQYPRLLVFIMGMDRNLVNDTSNHFLWFQYKPC